MNISNNFITHNSVQLKQNQQNSKALSFKAETKKDEVSLKSADSEELIKPNKYITMLSYTLCGAGLGCLIEKKFGFLAVITTIIGANLAENKVKISELNDKLKKIESRNK